LGATSTLLSTWQASTRLFTTVTTTFRWQINFGLLLPLASTLYHHKSTRHAGTAPAVPAAAAAAPSHTHHTGATYATVGAAAARGSVCFIGLLVPDSGGGGGPGGPPHDSKSTIGFAHVEIKENDSTFQTLAQKSILRSSVNKTTHCPRHTQ